MADPRGTASKSARLRARKRRLELDASRDEHDQLEEEASAAVLDALAVRTNVESELGEATRKVGEALRRLLDHDVNVERAAALLEVDATQVRRWTRTATAGTDARSSSTDRSLQGRRTRSAPAGPAAPSVTPAQRHGL